MNNMSKRTKIAATTIMSAMTTASMMVSVAMASDISQQVNSGLKHVYDLLLAIVLPIAAIAMAVCGVKIIWGNERSAEQGKQALIRIVIGVAIVFLAPFLVDQVSKWFSGTDSSIWDK